MTSAAQHVGGEGRVNLRFPSRARGWVGALLVSLVLAAPLEARLKTVDSDPAGARVEIVNAGDTRFKAGITYTTPAQIDFPSRREPYELRFSRPGFESASYRYDYGADESKSAPITVRLEALTRERVFRFTSAPSGAEVLVNGRVLGVTPLAQGVVFTRENARQSWKIQAVSYRLTDYQTESGTLQAEDPENQPLVILAALRETRQFLVTARTELDEPLPAPITLDGQPAGAAPLTLNLEFTRADKQSPWREFTVAAEIPGSFLPAREVLTREHDNEVRLRLSPLLELSVKRHFPIAERTPNGYRLGFDLSAPLGLLNDKELSSPAVELRRITNFSRDQTQFGAINSYCLTPDGQQVIYGVTLQNEDGGYYSNLFLKSASDQSYAYTQLTRGFRFQDSAPVMCREQGSNLVIFQSNRGPLDSLDISSFRLRENRVIGGIQQLTRESRFNYGPSFTSEHQPVYFCSVETYPRADPYLSFVRIDGSSYTNLGETGEMINRAESGLLYFVRKAEDTGKQQIFSVSSDGLSLTSVINDPESAKSNCFSPAISADGTRLLFVSDYHRDERGRANNNIYVYDLANGRIQQLTDNGSDDLAPSWSPTEPGVVFFLSNRGGAYNIWRMTLVSTD